MYEVECLDDVLPNCHVENDKFYSIERVANLFMTWQVRQWLCAKAICDVLVDNILHFVTGLSIS